MIRIASFGVLLLGGLVAFGAFYLARGSEGDVPQIVAEDPTGPAPTAAATPEVDRLYYLRDIAFDAGDITVMLFQTGAGGPVIIRDQDVLQRAADQVYVNTTTSTGQALGSAALTLFGAPPSETLVKVFRNDALIASVTCTNTACGSFAQAADIHHADLIEHATPYQVINDRFDDYQTYLDTILAVSEDPDFMLLDKRPRDDFPAERRISRLTLNLPTVVQDIDVPFDEAAHTAKVRAALTPHLPAEAGLERITVRDLGQAVIGDLDNAQAITAGGVPIPFPYARFYSVQAHLVGLTSLPDAAMDQITAATRTDFNVDDRFAAFVTERLQTTCVDCFYLKVDGPFGQEARVYDWRGESYGLDYYDLREAP